MSSRVDQLVHAQKQNGLRSVAESRSLHADYLGYVFIPGQQRLTLLPHMQLFVSALVYHTCSPRRFLFNAPPSHSHHRHRPSELPLSQRPAFPMRPPTAPTASCAEADQGARGSHARPMPAGMVFPPATTERSSLAPPASRSSSSSPISPTLFPLSACRTCTAGRLLHVVTDAGRPCWHFRGGQRRAI